MLLAKRRHCAWGKRLGRQQFIGGMHFGARVMVYHHELCVIEVKHLAKLFRDLNLVAPIPCREGLLRADPNQLFWISVGIAALRDGQAEWRCSQNVRDEAEALSVPSVEVWAGAFLESQFQRQQ